MQKSICLHAYAWGMMPPGLSGKRGYDRRIAHELWHQGLSALEDPYELNHYKACSSCIGTATLTHHSTVTDTIAQEQTLQHG